MATAVFSHSLLFTTSLIPLQVRCPLIFGIRDQCWNLQQPNVGNQFNSINNSHETAPPFTYKSSTMSLAITCTRLRAHFLTASIAAEAVCQGLNSSTTMRCQN
jgi:hypothetical protein